MKGKLAKGWYVACKYKGENGDLVLGKVLSVRRRSTGDVQVENLITGKKTFKKYKVLMNRNKRLEKKQVAALLEVWDRTKSDAKTKKAAIEMEEFRGRKHKKKRASKKEEPPAKTDVKPKAPIRVQHTRKETPLSSGNPDLSILLKIAEAIEKSSARIAEAIEKQAKAIRVHAKAMKTTAAD